ncbi:hypothetical protein SMICM17S_07400 [Streptomyces microflavus]
MQASSTISPDVWDPTAIEQHGIVIKGQHFFIRGLIEIPVIGGEDVFSWGVWVSLSKENFAGALDVWNTEGREAEKPSFGWLSTELALYSESTTDLKTNAHARPVGKRPFIRGTETHRPPARRRTACG